MSIIKLIKLSKYCIFIFLISSCSLITKEHREEDPLQRAAFRKGQNFVLNNEFEKAIPYLTQTLKQNDSDYNAALLLAARAYDKIGVPEKAILALQELLTKKIDSLSELKARSLLMKNLAKVQSDISQSEHKKVIDLITQNKSDDSILILESLNWSMDFNCDQFCAAEIQFLKEIQIQYLYIIENDEASAQRAANILSESYFLFKEYLFKNHFKPQFQNQIAVTLLESLRKLKTFQLNSNDEGFLRSKKFIQSFSKLETDVERWLYK